MNNCAEIRESLSASMDGELPTDKTEAVRLHVANCAACAEEQRQLERLDAALKSVLVPAESVGFDPLWRGVRARIQERPSRSADWVEWFRSRLTLPSLAWAVPIIILALIGLFSVDGFWPGARRAPRNSFASVESIDAYGRDVALLSEDETKTTVIWLFQSQEGEDEASGDNAQKGPTF
jgi:anti-sigma factor RsiW